MGYTGLKPADTQTIAQGPADIREELQGLATGQVVNAGLLQGYSVGNTSGKIPIANGTVCTGLNAEKVGGNLPSAFATAGHTHAAATTSSNGLMSNTDKTKLDGIATGAEVNQNSFGNVVAGGVTIQADAKSDTLSFDAGTGVTLTGNATTDTVTIAVTQDGHSHAAATTGAAGFMAAADKSKLDAIAAGAEVNQNTFANVVAGGVTLVADGKSDTLTINAGSGITITGDAANDALSIAVTANGHTHSDATASAAGFATAAQITKLNGIATGAEVNQNAFTNVAVGATTLQAETKTDTLTVAAGTGISLAGDAATDTMTISIIQDGHSHAAATTGAAGFMAAADKSKLDGIAAGAEVNQNTFANVVAGGVTLAADGKSDTLTINAGSGITITGDAVNDALSIAVTANGHTHTNATTGAAGFMAMADKVKLDGIATGAQTNQNAFSNVLVGSTTVAADSATDTLELIAGTNIALTPNATNDSVTIGVTGTVAAATTAGTCTGNAATATKLATARTISLTGDVTGSVSFDGSGNAAIAATVVDDSHAHVIVNVDGLQTALDGKLATTGTAAAATKLATARTISLAGDVTGSVSFDGSTNAAITATVVNDSHSHTASTLPALRDSIAVISGTIAHGTLLPLPTGFTATQCSWIISPVRPGWKGSLLTGNTWSDDDDEYCYVDDSRIVQCYHYNGSTLYPRTANYFVMGVK